jgi:two-component system OmpR family sensor kinase
MKLIPQGLTTRLVVSHLLVGLISIGIISTIAGYFIIDRGRRDVENVLEDTAFLVSNQLEEPMIEAGGTGEYTDRLKQVVDQFFPERPNMRYTIFLKSAQIITTNEPDLPEKYATEVLPEVIQALQGMDGETRRKDVAGQDIFYVAVPINHDHVIYGALRLSSVYSITMAASYRSLNLLIIIAILLVVAVVVEAFWLASSLARPIRSLTHAAEQLSQGKLLARATPAGPEELRQLAVTFNQMASHLQDNMEGMRAFVANASHELRTPLTAMKLNVDALNEGALDDPQVSRRFVSQIHDELELMIRTVTDLLDLSRIEAGRGQTNFEPVNLADLLMETRDFWKARALQAGVDLRINLPGEGVPIILGNEDHLRRLIHNLVDNGIKNTPSGGSVELALEAAKDRSTIRLDVRDTGSGIPDDHLPRIFERFYRVEPTQLKNKKPSGSGLGLAIAKSIVESHGAKIGVKSQMGVGSVFWVEFQTQKPRYEERKTIPRPKNPV